jgi:hypothetical protein
MTSAAGELKRTPRVPIPAREPSAAETYGEAPQLSPAQRRAVDDLRAYGIAVSTFADLLGDDALWQELDSEIEAFAERARSLAPKLERPDRKDQFLIRRWTPDSDGMVIDDPRIPSTSPWVRLAASDALLGVVNGYLGVYAKLVGLDNWYTAAFGEAYEPVASQRWHRDPEDRHVVKCFLYFSDVDDRSGPFEYVPGSTDGGRYGGLWAWGAEKGWYPPQDEFDARIPEADRLRLTGPKGTLILCDTGGFHRGGHTRGKPRLLATQTYVSPDAPQKKMYHEVVWRDGGAWSRAARYALTL